MQIQCKSVDHVVFFCCFVLHSIVSVVTWKILLSFLLHLDSNVYPFLQAYQRSSLCKGSSTWLRANKSKPFAWITNNIRVSILHNTSRLVWPSGWGIRFEIWRSRVRVMLWPLAGFVPGFPGSLVQLLGCACTKPTGLPPASWDS